MAEGTPNSSVQNPNGDQNPNSVEATIESGVDFGTTESTCNNNGKNAETSAVTSDCEREKSLEYAEELMLSGSKAVKEGDYVEATDYYSRAIEIRVAHFGELAPECANAYYKYGCALLYKAQDEADPLGSMPKKEVASQEDSNKDGPAKSASNGESSAASVSNDAERAIEVKDEEGEGGSDDEDLADGDGDESDLDLAWKMLDVARAIVEKHSGDTMEKVDILSALAEVALEREDVETSLSDYLKALSILERLVEPDSRLIAELNFRICLCIEIGSKPEEAIPYCEKAISVCKSRLQRLTNEVKNLSGPADTLIASDSTQIAQLTSDANKKAEIENLTGLCDELEKKREDLQHLVSNPSSILSDILGMISEKAKAAEKAAISVTISSSSQSAGAASTGGSTEYPAVSTTPTNGVTHLGVVGRGVKRVVMSSSTEANTVKKPSTDPSSDIGGGSAS